MPPSLSACLVVIGSLLTAFTLSAQAQQLVSEERIAVTARPFPDSIILRWAPRTFHVWRHGTDSGYTVERYVVARNGILLRQPEKSTLTTSLKPLPEEQWERLLHQSPYAAVAAQALYGDRFEIDLKETDVFSVVNKVQENEQRFYFALFSADMSASVARASGLWFTDTTAVDNEKYLYRIHVTGVDSLRGSIYINTREPYWLPSPQNLKIDFKGKLVSLRWDRALSTPYTAYKIERSDDGTAFQKIFESPLTTLSPDQVRSNQYEYATDSIAEADKIYYYRITGITPFGEEGPPSAVISGRSMPSVEQVPYIVSAASENNQAIVLRWDFPETDNNAIQGFFVERAPSPTTEFTRLTVHLLAPDIRSFEDNTPEHTNYYRVTALGRNEEQYASHIYFSQLVDSIPPLTPSGLIATADDRGVIAISWTANPDKDIYGYRVYKANHRTEELAQLTIDPVIDPAYFDTVDLNILNESVYYSVMAIDERQNHSSLSQLLEVKLPDKVRPQPPVLLAASATADGIRLNWLPGASEDIKEYRVYRKSSDKGWVILNVTVANRDSLFTFIDKHARPGLPNHYTVVSVDDAGLESDPAHPVQGVVPGKVLKPAIQWRKARLTSEENEISLSWTYDVSGIDVFTIFRSENGGPYRVHKTMAAEFRTYRDRIIPGRAYRYRMMVAFQDGSKSELSDELVFHY